MQVAALAETGAFGRRASILTYFIDGVGHFPISLLHPACYPMPTRMPLNEAETRAKLIDPGIKDRGWTEDHIRREETAGRVAILNRQTSPLPPRAHRLHASPHG